MKWTDNGFERIADIYAIGPVFGRMRESPMPYALTIGTETIATGPDPARLQRLAEALESVRRLATDGD